MIYLGALLFFVAGAEFLLLRSVYKELGEISQENAVNKVTIRRLYDQLKISARPAATLDESLKRMQSGEL